MVLTIHMLTHGLLDFIIQYASAGIQQPPVSLPPR